MVTGADAIGWRVEVFWEDEEQWFQGVITEYSDDDGYYVSYDDGDEKWQPSAAPDAMRFLAKTIAVDDASTELKGSLPVAASHDYSEDGFEDKPEMPMQSLQDGNTLLESDEATPEPTPRQHSELPLQVKVTEPRGTTPVVAPLLRARPVPAKPVRKPASNTIFFKDREELQEMRTKLEATKLALTDELSKLKVSLKAADATSAQLKQTMSDLTAKLTVAQLHPTTNAPSASSMDERMLELTARNRQMTAENAELATTKREIQGRRHKVTLVEVQLEIALLLQHKSNLEATLATRKVPSKPTTTVDVDGYKAKLAAADARIWDLKRESLDWKQRFEQEQAKASALNARRVNLGAQLARFRSSKALLRRAFDRCDGNGDGTLTLDETVQVLRLLSPGGNGDDDIEASIRTYFASTDANRDNAIDFDEFCKAFEHLMTA
ncbi:hypothetical protein SPRG_10259 [Saprolegnia parasitica CBS 223.65]|uniref:EF-hand domain-containing protein n=1 Tax=Saprolegnia parasitica (strain CBS 223.65) TaxID=695850 RepID=A0A067C6H2_SAPPC|nr:hypothetical protein SPRG_10259 [Saprolegnia parasitica CBS 223.65]KDO24725.1 hypothetical protein SPRG_10259 [Saprolegnia parasitica CBS 223.65]|eukprot:XP_012204605.1 hypothetical protein SPRG_10259 [Saprolegnia parasitica CBS 223.65]